MIITLVHLVLGTIKGPSKMCSLSHNTMPQMSQVLRERAIGMLTVGMSNWAVARELNVHFSTISCLHCHFREEVLRSFLSVIKPFVGKTHSDGLGLAPQWVGLAAKWVGLRPPRLTHGCAPAQSCEIHILGPNECISIDWFPSMNCNSVNSLKLLHVAFKFLFRIIHQTEMLLPSLHSPLFLFISPLFNHVGYLKWLISLYEL